MSDSYWNRMLGRRVHRRRGLMIAGATATGAAILAACGSESGGSGGSDQSGIVSKIVDTSKQAKRGGTNKWFFPSEPASLDPHIDQNPLNPVKALVYSNLLAAKPGHMTNQEYLTDPGIAESWEWSSDRLTLTFKLRQDVRWHNKAPVNGRALTAEDIVSGWKRWEAQGSYRTAVANVASPDAPVLSLTASDAKTITVKLKEPVVWVESFFASGTTGRFVIVPKETGNAFEPKTDMIGTGPYVMSSYTPSVGFTFKRHPEFYDKSRPFMDQIDAPIVLEYAQGLAQLKAGNLYTYSVRSEDIVSTKNEVPELKIYGNYPASFVTTPTVAFSYLPNSPFLDERVRQALSMSYDRELFIDTFANVSNFESQGLPVKTYWNTVLNGGVGSWLLEPRSKDFGANAKYYMHDAEEAKKLMAAAGHAGGLEVTSSFIQGTQLGADFQKRIEVLEGFAQEIGFKPQKKLIDYTKEYIPLIRDGKGQHEGLGYKSGVPTANDAVAYLVWRFSLKGGPGFLGFDATGKGNGAGDPQIEDMLKKASAEVDVAKRKALVYDIQRSLAKSMYTIAGIGIADNYLIAWPALANFQVYQGEQHGSNYNWWIDETQAPIKKA